MLVMECGRTIEKVRAFDIDDKVRLFHDFMETEIRFLPSDEV